MFGAIVLLLIVAACGAVWSVRYMTTVPGHSHVGPLPPLTADEEFTAKRLTAHITAVASRPHNVAHYEDLEKAAQYIEGELKSFGYVPRSQAYEADGKSVRNIEATIEPTGGTASTATVVVGAHYDSAEDAPGANDNGTGTAALLELARMLRGLDETSPVRIRLVFFVNEEPPYFNTTLMGSARYARLLRDRREPLVGMISLETLGSFSDQPGSQKYPPPLGLIYPNVGNFVAFVGLLNSRPFLHAAIDSFRRHTRFPSVGGVAPAIIPGISWSDHWSFSRAGYPAFMITDTAPFRYAHYHEPTDTIDKVDTEKLARIVFGVERLVREMIKPDWPTKPVAP